MAIVRSLTLTITLCLAWLTATGAAQDTSLFIAARTASPQEIQATINTGFNVNAQDQYGQTPLMYAAASNTNPDAVSVLVNAGANVNASTPAGWTALMFAARDNPNRAVAARLFELGADLDARNNEGMQAEDYAVARSSFNASAVSTVTTANTGMSNTNTGMGMNTGMNMGMAGAGTTLTSTGLTQLPSSFSRQRAINYYSPANNTMGIMGVSGMVTPATSMSAAVNASWQNPAANNRAYVMASNLPSRRMTRAPTDITVPAYTTRQQVMSGQAMGQAMSGQYMTPSGQMAHGQVNRQPLGLAQTNNYYTPIAPQAYTYAPTQTSNMGFTNISGVGQRQYYGTRLSDSFAGNYAPNNVIYGTQPATTLRNINQPGQQQFGQQNMQQRQVPPTSGANGVIMTSTGMQNINRMNGSMLSQAPGQGIATPLFDIPADNGVQPPAQAPTESTRPTNQMQQRQRTQNQQLLTQPSRLLYGPNAGTAAQTYYYQPYGLTYTADYGRQYNQSTPVNEQIALNDLTPCVNINRAAAPALLQIAHINTAAQVADITVERGFQLFSSIEELSARVDGIGAAQMADIRAQGLACIIFE